MTKNGVDTRSITTNKNGVKTITLPKAWEDILEDAISVRLEKLEDGIKLTPIK